MLNQYLKKVLHINSWHREIVAPEDLVAMAKLYMSQSDVNDLGMNVE